MNTKAGKGLATFVLFNKDNAKICYNNILAFIKSNKR